MNYDSIAIVIPCYKVKHHIMDVLRGIGGLVSLIYVVDDKCPEGAGQYVVENCTDSRVKVIFHEQNQGVGGASITGYKQALQDGATVIIKMDGDNQMDPALIPLLIKPIVEGKADYTKGNRFYNLDYLAVMPKIRLIGNSVLSLINKLTSGYWHIMDPTNGYTAIHAKVLQNLPLDKLDSRYFFESDMLFRLNTIQAVVLDVPMPSRYANEKSNLNIMRIIKEFPSKYLIRFFKRIFYNYYLRDFNAGTVELSFGFIFLVIGCIYGGGKWYEAYQSGVPAASGVVMLAAMWFFVGLQLLFSAIKYDIENTPKDCLHKLL